MEQNKRTYSDQKVVDYYDRYQTLQKPEQTIFDLLRPELPQMRMLDVGIGGGRTTGVFAPAVKEYVGTDYSAEMVERCKSKYAGKFPAARFEVADALDLSRFADSPFDLVLFSFNGVDTMEIGDRRTAIEQFRNSLVPGGYLCFSTHNIQALIDPPGVRLRLNIPGVLMQLYVAAKVRRINKSQLAKAPTADYVVINDGAHNFSLLQYFIRPQVQVKMLEDCGFKNTRCFSLDSGLEISQTNLPASNDPWIYYLSEKN